MLACTLARVQARTRLATTHAISHAITHACSLAHTHARTRGGTDLHDHDVLPAEVLDNVRDIHLGAPAGQHGPSDVIQILRLGDVIELGEELALELVQKGKVAWEGETAEGLDDLDVVLEALLDARELQLHRHRLPVVEGRAVHDANGCRADGLVVVEVGEDVGDARHAQGIAEDGADLLAGGELGWHLVLEALAEGQVLRRQEIVTRRRDLRALEVKPA